MAATVFREMNGYGRLVARADAEVRALVEAEEGQAVWGTTKAIRLELVDGLLKNILLSVHSPEGIASPQNAGLHKPLLDLLRLMLTEPRVKQLYPAAVGMMASLLESDVSLVPVWAEQGLLATFLTSIPQRLDTADAVANVLVALNQVYLHNAGEAEVLKHATPVHPLELLVPTIGAKDFAKLWSEGELLPVPVSAAYAGSTLDELAKNRPAARPIILKSLASMLKAMVEEGKQYPPWPQENDGGLPARLVHLGHFLHEVITTADAAEEFAKNGFPALLQLLVLPCLPPDLFQEPRHMMKVFVHTLLQKWPPHAPYQALMERLNLAVTALAAEFGGDVSADTRLPSPLATLLHLTMVPTREGSSSSPPSSITHLAQATQQCSKLLRPVMTADRTDEKPGMAILRQALCDFHLYGAKAVNAPLRRRSNVVLGPARAVALYSSKTMGELWHDLSPTQPGLILEALELMTSLHYDEKQKVTRPLCLESFVKVGGLVELLGVFSKVLAAFVEDPAAPRMGELLQAFGTYLSRITSPRKLAAAPLTGLLSRLADKAENRTSSDSGNYAKALLSHVVYETWTRLDVWWNASEAVISATPASFASSVCKILAHLWEANQVEVAQTITSLSSLSGGLSGSPIMVSLMHAVNSEAQQPAPGAAEPEGEGAGDQPDPAV
jgi:hypothetical protein